MEDERAIQKDFEKEQFEKLPHFDQVTIRKLQKLIADVEAGKAYFTNLSHTEKLEQIDFNLTLVYFRKIEP